MTSLAADRYERALSLGAVILLGLALAAIVRGSGHWGGVPWPVWLHLGPVLVALMLTPPILLRRRGDRPHRWLGYGWVAAMILSALSSLAVQSINPGHFSPIHLLSIYVLIQVPRAVLAARRGDLVRHRRTVRGVVTGGLLIAGALTFPFHRLLGTWLMGG